VGTMIENSGVAMARLTLAVVDRARSFV
jgi:hypothetical protein